MLYEYKAIVKRIYDGDTIYVDIDLGFGVWLKYQTIRLYGIDTPEIRGEERPEGLIAKDALLKWIPIESEIVLRTHKDAKEKYGRWLGEIYVIDIATNQLICINDELVKGGYAEKYIG